MHQAGLAECHSVDEIPISRVPPMCPATQAGTVHCGTPSLPCGSFTEMPFNLSVAGAMGYLSSVKGCNMQGLYTSQRMRYPNILFLLNANSNSKDYYSGFRHEPRRSNAENEDEALSDHSQSLFSSTLHKYLLQSMINTIIACLIRVAAA